MEAARNTAKDILSQVGEGGSFSSWRAALLEEQEVLCSLDASFAVEITFLQNCATKWYKAELHKRILDIMPDATRSTTVMQARIRGVASNFRVWVSEGGRGGGIGGS